MITEASRTAAKHERQQWRAKYSATDHAIRYYARRADENAVVLPHPRDNYARSILFGSSHKFCGWCLMQGLKDDVGDARCDSIEFGYKTLDTNRQARSARLVFAIQR